MMDVTYILAEKMTTPSYVKRNSTPFSNALVIEAKGLQLLRDSLVQNDIAEIAIPDTYHVDENALTMQSIDARLATQLQWNELGVGLAKMHASEHEAYGLSYDNYIGLSPQTNRLSENWGQFFVNDRLKVQINSIRSLSIRSDLLTWLDSVYEGLSSFLNRSVEHSSLVHGDLWSGNVLFDHNQVWLIDPAVYYGDREVDLAMTEMFGGFHKRFYQGYDSVYPRTHEYESKKVIYNLYHFLNHYNLFGDAYLQGCMNSRDFISELVR